MHWCFKNCFSYELMITCYLVSKCCHSICGSCHSRQEEQVAIRCPVCNTTPICYIPNIALRNAARALNCTCKYCKGNINLPEGVWRNSCAVQYMPWKDCEESTKLTPLVRRVEMHRHRTQFCPCLPASCSLTCGLEPGRYFACPFFFSILHLGQCKALRDLYLG